MHANVSHSKSLLLHFQQFHTLAQYFKFWFLKTESNQFEIDELMILLTLVSFFAELPKLTILAGKINRDFLKVRQIIGK